MKVGGQLCFKSSELPRKAVFVHGMKDVAFASDYGYSPLKG